MMMNISGACNVGWEFGLSKCEYQTVSAVCVEIIVSGYLNYVV